VTIRLNEAEARYLAAHLDRLLAWDSGTPVRVQVSGDSIGVFGVPPLGVITFVAVPLAEGHGAELDRTVSARDLRARVAPDVDFDIPEVAVPAAAFALLPPREGWQLPIPAVAGDLVPLVEESVEEFRARTVAVTPATQQLIAEEIWSRIAWAGLPMRVLHAAKQLGFISRDASRVAASTGGTWKRLTTARGQVFVHGSKATAPTGLTVVGRR
jgi:hypothetical protein